MLIEQIIEFELRGPGAPWPYMYSYNWLFSCQNKNLWGKSSSELLFTTKILAKLRNIIWTKFQVKEGLKQVNFFQLAFKC